MAWWHFSAFVNALQAVEDMKLSQQSLSCRELMNKKSHAYFDQFDPGAPEAARASAATTYDLLHVYLLLAISAQIDEGGGCLKPVTRLLTSPPPPAYRSYKPYQLWKPIKAELKNIMLKQESQEDLFKVEWKQSRTDMIHPDWLSVFGPIFLIHFEGIDDAIDKSQRNNLASELSDIVQKLPGVAGYFECYLSQLSGILRSQIDLVKMMQAKVLAGLVTALFTLYKYMFPSGMCD